MSHATEQLSRPRTLPSVAYQFSLQRLLVWFVVLGLVAAITARFGWLVGWAVLACTLASALAVWSIRYRRWWTLAAALPVVVLGIVPGVLAAGAPFRDTFYCCQYCGAHQEVESRWLQADRVKITESAAAQWAHSVGLPEHQHQFVAGSSTSRDQWFGYSLCACGGRDPVGTFHYASRYLGAEDAVARLREYQSLLNLNQPTKADAVVALAQDDTECIREEQERRTLLELQSRTR